MRNFKEQMQAIQKALDVHCETDAPQAIKHQLDELNCLLANAAWIKGEAKRILLIAEMNAFNEIKKSLRETGEKYSATELNYFINGKCAKENADYIEADRLNAGLSHKISSLISTLSYEKTALERGIE